MKYNSVTKHCWTIAFLMTLCCCSLVPENTSDPVFKPDGMVALGEHSFSVWELIGKSVPEESEESVEETRVTLQYLQEKALTVPAIALYNMKTDTLLYTPYFEIDKGDGITFGVPLAENKVFSQEFVMSLASIPAGVEIKYEDLIADLTYVFPYTGFDYGVKITLKNIFFKGMTTPVVLSGIVTKDNTKGIRKNMSVEFTADLTDGNDIHIETEVTIMKGAVLFEPQTIALLTKSLNMRLQKATGYFPVPPMSLDSNNLKMNLDILSSLSNAFDLSDPRYYLIIRNKGFGFPTEVQDIQLHAKNSDASKSVTLETKNRMFFEPNTENVLRIDTFAYSSENSNLIEFLSLPPHGNVSYTGTIRFNPNGDTGIDNVIYADGVSQVDSYVEIPLVMKSASMLYKDTLEVDFEEQRFGQAELAISATTDIPFEMTILSVNFYNAEYEWIGTIEFGKRLVHEKGISEVVSPELLAELSQVKYCVSTIRIAPSLDILAIRQDAFLKLNFTMLGENK